MKRWILILSLLLASCDGAPSVWEIFESTNNCLGPYSVKNNAAALNPTALRQDEIMLKALFTTPWTYHPQDHDGNIDYTKQMWHDKLLPSAKAFCESFGGVHIQLEWNYQFSCLGGKAECWGLDDPHGIFMEYSANSFLHELLHVYEWENGILNTGDHPDWDLKGFNYLNDTVWDHERSLPVLIAPDGGVYPPVN